MFDKDRNTRTRLYSSSVLSLHWSWVSERARRYCVRAPLTEGQSILLLR